MENRHTEWMWSLFAFEFNVFARTKEKNGRRWIEYEEHV